MAASAWGLRADPRSMFAGLASLLPDMDKLRDEERRHKDAEVGMTPAAAAATVGVASPATSASPMTGMPPRPPDRTPTVAGTASASNRASTLNGAHSDTFAADLAQAGLSEAALVRPIGTPSMPAAALILATPASVSGAALRPRGGMGIILDDRFEAAGRGPMTTFTHDDGSAAVDQEASASPMPPSLPATVFPPLVAPAEPSNIWRSSASSSTSGGAQNVGALGRAGSGIGVGGSSSISSSLSGGGPPKRSIPSVWPGAEQVSVVGRHQHAPVGGESEGLSRGQYARGGNGDGDDDDEDDRNHRGMEESLRPFSMSDADAAPTATMTDSLTAGSLSGMWGVIQLGARNAATVAGSAVGGMLASLPPTLSDLAAGWSQPAPAAAGGGHASVIPADVAQQLSRGRSMLGAELARAAVPMPSGTDISGPPDPFDRLRAAAASSGSAGADGDDPDAAYPEDASFVGGLVWVASPALRGVRDRCCSTAPTSAPTPPSGGRAAPAPPGCCARVCDRGARACGKRPQRAALCVVGSLAITWIVLDWLWSQAAPLSSQEGVRAP